ncbi:RNA polymerase sigma factor [Candidatus Symbiobacter mobilis]|uniref:RNA polymerase sigma factor n=1 Tax=Candidatus Symbiobacter mobilis TaxID=1436290 RepID=UPI00059D770A|nr:RNA polymerase sigma factor [Candidatus Symbiobacter mobilis]
MATAAELSDFLQSIEKRAFKRAVYHVGNDEVALDIVQDSMMRLAEHYGDKPVGELLLLFQRILGNAIMDWFRRQSVQKSVFASLDDLLDDSGDADCDVLDSLHVAQSSWVFENPQDNAERMQTLQCIEREISLLPPRQREAFLLRYWEELDVRETAAAMGCSEGSVKVHCSRAVQALLRSLLGKGMQS